MPRVLLTSAVLLFAAAGAARGAGVTLVVGPPTAEVKVVATSDELRNAEAITTGDYTFRVGIESNTVAYGSGVMVYTWTDGRGANSRNAQIKSDEQFVGPLLVTLVPQKGSRLVTYTTTSSVPMVRAESMFAGIVVPPKPGDYDVKFYSVNGDLVAQTTLRAEEKEPQFQRLERDGALADKGEIFGPSARGAPQIRPGILDASAKELPRVSTITEDPNLSATMENGVITLKSKDNSTLSGQPNQFLLARYYVNGKPVAPKYITRGNEVGFAAAPKPAATQTVRLSTDPETYGAKPGDTVEVQLMFSPTGWRDVVNGNAGYYYSSSARGGIGRAAMPRLYPKVTLIGDAATATTAPATAPAPAPAKP